MLLRQCVPCFELVANELAELDATCRRRACVRARKREETVDKPGETLDLCERARELGLARRLDITGEIFKSKPKRGQRRSQLMRGVRDEVLL